MLRLILFILAGTAQANGMLKDSPADTLKNAEKRYGKLYWDYTWERKSEWLVPMQIKDTKVHVNKDMQMALVLVLAELENLGLMHEIERINGCYSPRSVRNKNYPSVHAYGLGCDFNAFIKGDNAKFSERFINVWERWGFCWGGRFNDPMHFSYAWECNDQKAEVPYDDHDH